MFPRGEVPFSPAPSPLVSRPDLVYVVVMRTIQPNQSSWNTPSKRPKQDIPSEAARIQARLAGRKKTLAEAKAAEPKPEKT